MQRSLLCSTVLLLGCAPELETGSYTAQLSGTQVLVDGSESPYTASVDVTVVLQSVRGPDTYLMTFCEGLVSYLSSAPCLDEASVVDGAEGLVSHDEYYFYDDTTGCTGVENLYVTGEILSETEADLQVEYILTVDDGYTLETCFGDRSYRISASGTLAN